ncbi:PSD1 and planctomycete cytochrome C domain-containing protein [Humisphaera borealis]|uniref:PSD1 domain-containing protein n=1 Tax=Humisphaera borealis TaxID=2807512 RepID=A0A7M2X2B0_9BACT|nr:PSD1 and planctomycete cytochrome C domain-containing protein [Humisphaera borealis]QOV91804.1 PSD1 domain-containing protein [Humisphaera borealis]
MKARFLTLTTILGAAAGLAAAAAVPTPVAAPAPTPAAAPGQTAAPAAVANQKPTKEQLDFFENKIRPVLVGSCYKCHSAEEKKAKGGLVLDTREGWMHGGENGTAIIPGNPEKSLLIKAVQYHDEDLQMPPDGNKLEAKQIADLVTWVKMGAPDPRTNGGVKLTGLNDTARHHWSFQPIQNSPVPAVKNAGWVKNPVDNFVLSKLEQSGMVPNHPAARETLLRRATYDLIGLPPTPEEITAFQKDTSPNAFEKVIDRLLASPQYGERWGRYWLDSARYSDTSGIENNNRGQDYRYAYAWTYRDYVINSFNADKPYDQFLKEQIAADLLPTAKTNPETLAALGFLTVGKRFQNPNDQIDERIDALTKATMALTVSCARCHDHKFDPVPTADYYSLHGVFVSTEEPVQKPLIGTTPTGPEYQDFIKRLTELEAKNRDQYYSTIESKHKEFYRKSGVYLQVGMMYRSNDAEQINARNKLIAEHKLDRDLYQTLRIDPRRDSAVMGPFYKFSQLKAEDYAAKVPEILKQIQGSTDAAVAATDKGADKAAEKNKADRKADRKAFVSSNPPINPLVKAAFKDVKPEQIKSFADVSAIYGKMFAALEPRHAEYLKASRSTMKGEVTGFSEEELEILNFPIKMHPASSLSDEGFKVAIADLRLQNGGFQRFSGLASVNELQLTHPGSPARAMVVEDSERPRNSYVFIRGEAQNRGPIVPRQFLEIIAGKDRKPFSVGSGRRELADSIATPANPLTARVAVNRMWARHFGDGFVRTLDDMGVMCDPPSHPELLDYLASRFIAEGWSFKKMHKLIMTSATYQLSSDANPAYVNKDPDNRLMWRANLRRLDFEAIRDTMLMFTGKLDLTLGGKPVNLTDEPYSNRRSVYGYIDRGLVPELMQQFDFADPDMANSKRTSTIVPQQALFFMNSPMSVDVARKAVSREEFVNAKDDVAKVKALYEVIFQRAPKAQEVQIAREFVAAASAAAPDQVSKAAVKSGKTRTVDNTGKYGNLRAAIKNSGELVERRPLTVWEQYAQALLMSNEIAYVN